MTNSKRKTTTRPAREAERQATNDRRTAAQFPDEPPRDIDTFRLMLARRINMFVGTRRKRWCACKEPLCRRARACMAPRIECSNALPLPPDPDRRRERRNQAIFNRMLRERLEQIESERK